MSIHKWSEIKEQMSPERRKRLDEQVQELLRNERKTNGIFNKVLALSQRLIFRGKVEYIMLKHKVYWKISNLLG